MATKKKTKKAKSSKQASNKRAFSRKSSTARGAAKKESAKRAAANKRPKTRSQKAGKQRKQQIAGFEERPAQARSGAQSGDLQGLRDIEGADSESVNELLEEGNAFEADVVAGVEQADDDQEREVHTHEVSEDDVPEEYLDKD